MPITQERVKRIVDAGLTREHDFITLHNAISYCYIRWTRREYPDGESFARDILVELHATKALLRPDATLATEETRYHFTHSINTHRKERMRHHRAQLRAQGLISQDTRETRDSIPMQTPQEIELARDNAAEFIPDAADLMEMLGGKTPPKPLIDAEEDARAGAEREAKDPEYAKIMQQMRERWRKEDESKQ